MSKKKKLLITLLLIFILGLAGTITLGETYGGYHGKVEGTNFVLKEWVGAGTKRYDVDDEGNFYFLVQGGMFAEYSSAVVIYDANGRYKYTLVAGGNFVHISSKNTILVYDSKGEEMREFANLTGEEVQTTEVSYENAMKRFGFSFDISDFSTTIRERDGIRYENDFGTIKRFKDGKEEVVFTVPPWQIWYKIIDTIKYIALAGLFVFGFVIPVIKKTNGYD